MSIALSPVTQRDENQRVLQPPQFRLRTLFIVVAGLGVLFSLMTVIGALASFVLAFTICLLLCHVAGNAIGTTLGDRAEGANLQPVGASLSRDAVGREARAQARLFIPPLGIRKSLPRVATTITLLGSTAGAIVGGAGLTVLSWQFITPGAVALAILSSAVLGGFAGFLLSSFVAVFAPALREASRVK